MNQQNTLITGESPNLLDFKINSQICPFCGETLLKDSCIWLPCKQHQCHTSCLERLQNTLETPFCLECCLNSEEGLLSKMFRSALVSFLNLESSYKNNKLISREIYLQSLQTYLLFLKLYNHGVPRCTYFLGMLKQSSQFPTRDINESATWFKISDDQDNHRKSQLFLGKLNLKNDRISESRYYLSKASTQGEGEALFHLGMIERNNPSSLILIKDAVQNIKKSQRNYIKPIFNGNINWQTLAIHELGLYYKHGQCITKDIRLAKESFFIGAQRGYVNSQRELAFIYQNDNTYKNLVEAKRWFNKAGNQGDSRSLLNLGIIYFKGGIGVNKNLKLSAKYFLLAKNLGESIAESYLGDLYTFALSPNLLDVEMGIKFFKRAAEFGDKVSQYTLGCYYHLGTYQDILPKDISLAIYWYRKSAQQGSSLSQYYLGKLLGEKGAYQNKQEALEWLRKASLNGISEADACILKL